MSILGALLNQTVRIERSIGNDGYGKPKYDESRNYTARVEPVHKRVQDNNGMIIVASVRVIMEGDVPLTQEDRITLPDGSTPRILSIVKRVGRYGDVQLTEVIT